MPLGFWSLRWDLHKFFLTAIYFYKTSSTIEYEVFLYPRFSSTLCCCRHDTTGIEVSLADNIEDIAKPAESEL